MESHRAIARALARQYIERDDPLGWFEALYTLAEGDRGIIPWADMFPNPHLVRWLDEKKISGRGKRALKIGCGLGDDAEELARRGFGVIAFDVSEMAIRWCVERFANSKVSYVCRDLFEAPSAWEGGFDLVLESYTLQVLPPTIRQKAMARVARFVAPGGTLLVICRGRDLQDHEGHMPWPLTKDELRTF